MGLPTRKTPPTVKEMLAFTHMNPINALSDEDLERRIDMTHPVTMDPENKTLDLKLTDGGNLHIHCE